MLTLDESWRELASFLHSLPVAAFETVIPLPAPVHDGDEVLLYHPPGADHYPGEPDGQGFHWWPCRRCGCWVNGGDHDDGSHHACGACIPPMLSVYARRPWWWAAERPYTTEDAQRLRAQDAWASSERRTAALVPGRGPGGVLVVRPLDGSNFIAWTSP